MDDPATTPRRDPSPAVPGPVPTFPRDTVEFNRILAMSDGVAAIALTILVLQINVPAPSTAGGSAASVIEILGDLSTPLFAFTLSFVLIAASWYSHHRFIGQLRGLDVPLVVWNFAFLFVLVLVPFASDLVGTYGENAGAAVVYALVMATLYAMGVPGQYLARRRGLTTDDESDQAFRARLLTLSVPPAAFLATIPVTLFLDAGAGYWLLIVIWPLITLSERRRARILERDAAARPAA